MDRRTFLRSIWAAALGMAACPVFPAFCEGGSGGGKYPKPGKGDRCPVCGMFSWKYPKWGAGFVFRNGKTYFHCSPKCMLHNYNHISKYQPGKTKSDLAVVWVTDYYTTKKIDARHAFFVVGSKLVGPMGLDLIPVRERKAAENLKKDYKGKVIVTLDQVTPRVVEMARKGRFK